MAHEILAPWAEKVEGVGPMTADELLAMGEDASWRHELVAGTLVQLPVTGFYHSIPCSELLFVLYRFVKEDERMGLVLGPETGFDFSRSVGADTVLAPDVTFISAGRLPPREQRYEDRFIQVTPDLVGEIAEATVSADAMAAKARLYLDAGVRLVWIVWPATRAVDIWRPGSDVPVATLTEHDALDGLEVVPGFTCPVAELFQ